MGKEEKCTTIDQNGYTMIFVDTRSKCTKVIIIYINDVTLVLLHRVSFWLSAEIIYDFADKYQNSRL